MVEIDGLTPANAGEDHGGRFRPGQSGNPGGKAPGVRNRATVIAEALLDGHVKQLVEKLIQLALAGDPIALRLAIERLVPPRRHRPVAVDLPVLETAGDAVIAMTAIVKAVGEGVITPNDAEALTRLVSSFASVLETHNLAQRVEALENRAIENDGTE